MNSYLHCIRRPVVFVLLLASVVVLVGCTASEQTANSVTTFGNTPEASKINRETIIGESTPPPGLDRPGTTIPPPNQNIPEPEPSSTTAIGNSNKDNLGLEEIVDQYMRWVWSNNSLEADRYEPPAMIAMRSAGPDMDSRLSFEVRILSLLVLNQQDNPLHLQLISLMNNTYQSCLHEAGYPQPEVKANLTKAQRMALLNELGFSETNLIRLRDSCWENWLTRSSKSTEIAEQLELMRQYMLKIAEEWAAENPELVVPLPEQHHRTNSPRVSTTQ